MAVHGIYRNGKIEITSDTPPWPDGAHVEVVVHPEEDVSESPEEVGANLRLLDELTPLWPPELYEEWRQAQEAFREHELRVVARKMGRDQEAQE